MNDNSLPFFLLSSPPSLSYCIASSSDLWAPPDSNTMPDELSDRMPENMTQYMSERVPEKISDRMPEYRSDRMSEKMLNIYVRNDVSWWGSLEVIRIGYIKTHFLYIQNCQLIPYLGDINRNWSHTLHCFMAEKWYETPDVSRKYQFRQVS